VSRGVGFETAKLLLAEGVRVLGVARDPERVARVNELLAPLGDYSGVVADVGVHDAAELVSKAARERFGALDVLVNNAAILHWSEGWRAEGIEPLERSLQINVLGPHRLILSLLPLLEKGDDPRIVNVSSGAGRFDSLRSDRDMPSYRLSKYALNGMTMLLATELAGKIAVNSLDPGWLKTDMGGKNAPGEPIDGAHRILAVLRKPGTETGKFWYGDEEIKF
jgi:NAD(P)-dependent dehydrogenase (short-subunit alcohol dehydrogenase family)